MHNGFSIYSLVGEGRNLSIQSRQSPFDEYDEVPLGMKLYVGGNFTIQLDNFDGLFFDIENECKCTNVLGTEFKDFSLSERINAGVQIVSVLSKKIGLQFPIWIDNRESVSELYPIDTQIINLKVLGKWK